ncbi:MAG: rubrerythrin, partial [Leptospiraceae bacterium]|nr:rubrerythrin [Leptospiraceae bacterium]
KAAEDARDFYNKLKDKFSDPEIKIFFKRLSDYNEENHLLIEAQYQVISQKKQPHFYWEEESSKV